MFEKITTKIRALMNKAVLKKEIKQLEKKKDVLKKLQKNPPNIKVEETEICGHPKLKQLESMWYQCENPKCRVVLCLFGAAVYDKDQLIEEQNNIRGKLKEKE